MESVTIVHFACLLLVYTLFVSLIVLNLSCLFLQLKVDKVKLIDLCGTSSPEFTTVSTSIVDLCFDVFGIAKEKKDPTTIKGNRELLDALPNKIKHGDDSHNSDDSSGDDQDELDKILSFWRCNNQHCKYERNNRAS